MGFEVTATRKRPQQFETLAGQEFVVSTLRNAINSGHIAHAYLFSGPRGVGKTTSARLLAKALNCENGPTASPCGKCSNCLGIAKGSSMDVIEIDGASNTSVNDIRTIKEEVLFPPAASRYKIYIIDEVHMLSQSAFNALLKTIEEPPDYVIFIFATTETQKVPATIRSRCQQFSFQLLSLDTIQRLLAEAAAETGIEAEPDALFWIAKESTGSMRDAYTLFDQVASFSEGKITLDKIREKLGIAGTEAVNGIVQSLLDNRTKEAFDSFHELLARGMSVEQLVKDFAEYFRCLLMIRSGVRSENVLGQRLSDFNPSVIDSFSVEQLEKAMDIFLELYRNIRYSLNPQFEAELAVSRLSRLKYMASNATVLEQIARLKNDLITGKVTPLNPAFASIKSVEAAREPEVVKIVEENNENKEPDNGGSPETAEPENSATIRGLDDILPEGCSGYRMTDEGLCVEFSSKFSCDMALRNFSQIKQSISSRIGGKNVFFSVSGVQSDVSDAEPHEAPVSSDCIKEEPVKAGNEQVMHHSSPEQKDVKTEQTDFINDLIIGLKGHRV